MAKYGVVETTKITEICYDFVNATTDIENGWVAKKGDLATGERNIYNAVVPATTDKVYLVANPAWSYKSDISEQNEENFINVKGKPFKVYGLAPTNKFGVSDYTITPVASATAIAVGDYIGVDGSTMKLKDLGTTEPTGVGFYGKVTEIEDYGIFPCINVATVTSPSGNPPTGGGEIVAEGKKIVIEVVKNETV